MDFIFYEIQKESTNCLNYYFLQFINILKIILTLQSETGVCIMKISFIFHKPVIDILYILTSLYEKVYIMKPNTCNIIHYEKYIVCKNFILNENKREIYNNYYNKLNDFSRKTEKTTDNCIKYIIKNDLPCYFINKIDDMNIIIGQQQLEGIIQIMNILKNKNKEIKLDFIKKTNIKKCIQWCEKYNIPCNKFIEKSNIFLRNTIEESEIENELEQEI